VPKTSSAFGKGCGDNDATDEAIFEGAEHNNHYFSSLVLGVAPLGVFAVAVHALDTASTIRSPYNEDQGKKDFRKYIADLEAIARSGGRKPARHKLACPRSARPKMRNS